MDTMKAVAFQGRNRLAIEERTKPVPMSGQAVLRVTTTTICGY
jgi:threonine dehydrogenase-like Zn-dependent dehydrogenase